MIRGPLATLSVLRIINFRAIRRHAWRAALAAFSLGGGVAVVVAVLIETTSVQTAVDDVGYQIAGPAPLRVVGAASRGGITPAAIAKTRTVPGVGTVVPVVRAVTMITDDGTESFGLALGIDCSAQWIVDPKVCEAGQTEPPPATSAVFGKTLHDDAVLQTDAGRLEMRDFQQISDLDGINKGLVVVLPLSVAQTQFARGERVDMLYVTVAGSADEQQVQADLTAKLGPGFHVASRSEPARGFNVNSILLPLLAIFALISVGVGVILIVQITRLSVEERRRDIAVAAALGASPLSIGTGFLAEAALLGAVGAAMGIATGIGIAVPVVASASELTEHFLGVTVPVVLDRRIFAIGPAIGVLLAVLAALLPSRAAARTPIAAELSGRAGHEQTGSRRLALKTLALLTVAFTGAAVAMLATRTGGLAPWQAITTDIAMVVAVVGALMATAYLSAQAIALIRQRPDLPRDATPALALANLRSHASRTAAIAGAVAVPVVVVVLLSGFLIAIHRGAIDVAEAQAQDRIAVTTTRFADYGPIDARFAPATVAQLRDLAEVGGIERMAEIEINLADGSLAHVQAQDRPTFPFGLLSGARPEDSVAAGELVIGGILAREKGLRVGDTVLLGSGRGARAMTVGSIVATPEYGGQRIYLPYGIAEEIYGRQPAGLVFLSPSSGHTRADILTRIAGSAFTQQIVAVDTAGYAGAIAASVSKYLNPLNALKYGLLAIAFVSVLATLLLVGMRRRREVALIQALGATRWRVFSISTAEAVIAGGVGALFGAVLSLVVIQAVRHAAVVNVGLVAPMVYPVADALLYAGLATLAAVLAAVIPAWRSTRSTPATELRDE